MSEPPPRKRFQFHLSTAIVMMFVAGALTWMNIRIRRSVGFLYGAQEVNANSIGFSDYGVNINYHGWPFEAIAHYTEYVIKSPIEIHWTWLLADLSMALAILFATWFLCEWLIRRRAAQKGR